MKDVENVHPTVHPPAGRGRVAAPRRMGLDTIRGFAISKPDWIKRQRRKLREQERETPRESVTRESRHVRGRRYLLELVEREGPPSVEPSHRRLVLRVRPGAGDDEKRAVVEQWYREQLKRAIPPLIAKWEPVLGVTVSRFFIRRMKTKWGSCNAARQHPPKYGTGEEAAEMPGLRRRPRDDATHPLEPTRNARFAALTDRSLPQWGILRKRLNELPVRHEEWGR